jgi:prefoldin subunit 5
MSLAKAYERVGKEADKYEEKLSKLGKKVNEDKKAKLTEIFEQLSEAYDNLTEVITKIEHYNLQYGKKKKVTSDSSSSDEKEPNKLKEANESKEHDCKECEH